MSSIQFSGVYGIYAVEPILPENGISGITPFCPPVDASRGGERDALRPDSDEFEGLPRWPNNPVYSGMLAGMNNADTILVTREPRLRVLKAGRLDGRRGGI